jgi:hypothetical protein
MAEDDAEVALIVADQTREQVAKLADAVEKLAKEVVKLAGGKAASTANASSAASKAGGVKRALR